MPDILEQIMLKAKDTGNLASGEFYIPLHVRKGGFGTLLEDENPNQFNEGNYFTRGLHLHYVPAIRNITNLPYEDLAPELRMSEAAHLAQSVVTKLPEDMLDADLGSGL
jgi:hypothetical protein